MSVSESIGKAFPFARWSVLRMGFGMRKLLTEWQVGDGREARLQRYVLAKARKGDLDDAIATTKACMVRAGRDVCGFDLDVDVTPVRWPERYVDDKGGQETWNRTMQYLSAAEGGA